MSLRLRHTTRPSRMCEYYCRLCAPGLLLYDRRSHVYSRVLYSLRSVCVYAKVCDEDGLLRGGVVTRVWARSNGIDAEKGASLVKMGETSEQQEEAPLIAPQPRRIEAQRAQQRGVGGGKQ